MFHDLVRVSHAVFNNLRGDQPARLGLTYAALRDVNPAGADWFLARQVLFQSHIGHSPLLDLSVNDVTQFLRYYPLISFSPEDGFDENMAVKVARL